MPKLIVFSGAGLSAESGLATFRNTPSGLWENHPIDKVCNYLTWEENFDLVHGFYNMRRSQLASVKPNAAHQMIAEWQSRYETVILTQNVDDLLERAGCTDVVHLHGFLPEMMCEACGHVWNIGYAQLDLAGRCPKCQSRKGIKPNVVFFHQEAPRYEDYYRMLRSLKKEDVVVVVGTSGAVIPISYHLATCPGYKIFNGLEAADIPDSFDENLLMPATEAFPLIDRTLKRCWIT
jgi:NAD-dependent deacetylase